MESVPVPTIATWALAPLLQAHLLLCISHPPRLLQRGPRGHERSHQERRGACATLLCLGAKSTSTELPPELALSVRPSVNKGSLGCLLPPFLLQFLAQNHSSSFSTLALPVSAVGSLH